jgi:hypothetical protein
VPVSYRIIGDDWRDGRTENISRTGALVRASDAVRVGSEIDVVLTLPAGILGEQGGEYLCAGTVIRLVAAQGEGLPGFGVMFRRSRLTVHGRTAVSS